MLKFNYKYASNLDSVNTVSKELYTTLITLDDVKNMLGLVIGESYDDTYLTDLIDSACLKVEKYINKSIVTSEYEAVYNSFSDSTFLPYGVAGVISAFTSNGEDVDTGSYDLKNGIVYKYNSTNQVIITYNVTITAIDPVVKSFVYSLVKHLYDPLTYEYPNFKQLDCLTRRPIF